MLVEIGFKLTELETLPVEDGWLARNNKTVQQGAGTLADFRNNIKGEETQNLFFFWHTVIVILIHNYQKLHGTILKLGFTP